MLDKIVLIGFDGLVELVCVVADGYEVLNLEFIVHLGKLTRKMDVGNDHLFHMIIIKLREPIRNHQQLQRQLLTPTLLHGITTLIDNPKQVLWRLRSELHLLVLLTLLLLFLLDQIH